MSTQEQAALIKELALALRKTLHLYKAAEIAATGAPDEVQDHAGFYEQAHVKTILDTLNKAGV